MLETDRQRDARRMIALEEARELVCRLKPLPGQTVPLAASLGRVCAEEVAARVSCPSATASLKDGYALQSGDVVAADRSRPVCLRLLGTVVAGGSASLRVTPGTAVRIMTGGRVPPGADAVLASEFAAEEGDLLHARADAHPGRNILAEGADIASGAPVVGRGVRLGPGHLGLLAAAGVDRVRVFAQPRVMIAATGSELVAPGEPIAPGMVAASNMVTLQAELAAVGVAADCRIFRDDLAHLEDAFAPLLAEYDVVLTCGGVLDGDKDLTLAAMARLGVELVFHRVRMGPGKGIAMGRRGRVVVFNLPGGPPSNHIAFLQLALPGIRRLGGAEQPFAGKLQARVPETVRGMEGWTQFVYAVLKPDASTCGIMAEPFRQKRRLRAMAEATCLIEIPENTNEIEAGQCATVWNIR